MVGGGGGRGGRGGERACMRINELEKCTTLAHPHTSSFRTTSV